MPTDDRKRTHEPADYYSDVKALIYHIRRTSKYGSNFFLLGAIAFFARHFVVSTPGDGAPAIVRGVAASAFAVTFFLLILLVIYDFFERRSGTTTRKPPRGGVAADLVPAYNRSRLKPKPKS